MEENHYASKDVKDSVPYVLPRWKLKDETGTPVCNFIPRVLTLIQVCSPDRNVIEEAVRLSLEFGDGVTQEITLELSKLQRIDWSKMNSRCILNENYRNVRGCIVNIIRAGLHNAPIEIVFQLGRLGVHNISETVVFNAGDRVFTDPSATKADLKFELGNLPFKLDIDPNLTPQEAFKGMRELIVLSPEVGRVLVAHVISGIVRSAFKEAGLIPCTILVIVGESGMLKSHFIPHLAQLYNRADGIRAVTRFNSTKRFIEDSIWEYSECTAVIDDLHTAESGGIKRKNEDTAEEIIRRIGDNTGRGYMEGHRQIQKQFMGNVVFIGEYTIGRASTIPRELVVKITKRPNGEILDKYQRHQPLLVSTFYSFFIQWYVDHFDVIRNEIDKRLTELRKTSVNSNIHGRLCDTKFYLQISFMLFLEFCKEAGFITEEDERDEYMDFSSQLNDLISEQQARFKSNIQAEKIDYLNLIRKLYTEGRFCVAKKKKDFNPDKHEGVICYDCLCLRGKYLERKIKNINASLRLEDCIQGLLAQNALKLVENKNTVQISGTGGKRFYAVKLDKLI